MKRFLTMMAVVLTAALSASAQRTISGTVVDKADNEPIIQATVSLLKTDSTLVSNTVSNIQGNFSITAPQDGNYLLRLTYVGYKTLFRSIAMSGRPVQLGTLQIEVDAIMLQGAEIVRNQTRMYSRGDTIVYNADAFRTPEGSVIEELVRRLPGAEISDDGKITINGKEVKKIKVDGREFMVGDTQTAMKNLPTSIVERVQAYDERSDQARITGIDDGEEQTVLDFGLRRGMNQGSFVNVDAGVGTKDRYTGRVMGMKFRDGLRVFGMGNANNVSDRGFMGGGPGGFRGGAQGLQASKSLALNLNYEIQNRLTLDGSVRWNHNDVDAWSRSATENFVSSSSSFSNSISQNYSRSNSWNGNFRVEWTPDSTWNIHFRPSFSLSTNDSRNQSFSASFAGDPYSFVDYALNSSTSLVNALNYMRTISDTLVVNSRDNGGLNYSDNNRLGGELQVNKRLSSNGRNIALRLTGNYTDGESRSLSLQDVTLYQLVSTTYGGDSTYMKNRYSLTPTKNYDYSARLSYSEPIADRTYLQFSYTFQYRYTKSDRSTYDFSTPTPYPTGTFGDLSSLGFSYRDWNPYLSRLTPLENYYDDQLSRFSQYKNYIHTAEVMFRVVRDDYNFNVGVQVVPQTSEFSYRYLNYDDVTRRSVVNWSPTANFRYKISEQGNIRLQYRGTTSQPSMSDMLPITDDSDPLNISVGNPNLKPSFSQSFNLRFNNYYPKHQRFVFANVRFSTTSNSVASKVSYDPTTGGRTLTRDNINGNWSTGAEFMFNTALDTLGRFNMNWRTTANYAHSVNYLDKYSVSHNMADMGNILKNSVNETNLGQRIGFSYRNDWFEFEPNGSVNYTFGRNKLQSSGNQDTWNFSYGFNTTAQLPWGMQLTTNLNMQSRRGNKDASMNTNELIWNAQIAQSFLKGSPLSVRLEFNDILGRQSSFTRMLNAMMRSDSENNSINSYVMLRVNYRLNMFGGQTAQQGPGGNRQRGGGFGGFGGPGRF
jgi:hypothetical protein